MKPEISIGLFGHVDHGKTTLTERLTGKWTDTHSEEVKKGITIKLGYANASFYFCEKCKKYTNKNKCEECNEKAKFSRMVSFVDAPGHESLMATMLSGAAIIDGALLLISATEECPQPQTREHLMTLQIIGIKNIVVIQNKIDAVSKEEALKNYKQIKDFLAETEFKNAHIIPISALHNININVLIEAIEKEIKTPQRNLNTTPLFFIARSFDINKPGTTPDKMMGGVLGGAMKEGIIKNGQDIEILPGRETIERNQKIWKSVVSKITAIKSGEDSIEEATPGGSIALMSELDPSIVKSDSLSGNVLGIKGKMPPVFHDLILDVKLLERVLGTKELEQIEQIKVSDVLMLNSNTSVTVGIVNNVIKNKIFCKLKRPICASIGSRVTISRRVGNRFRLIGYGLISQAKKS